MDLNRYSMEAEEESLFVSEDEDNAEDLEAEENETAIAEPSVDIDTEQHNHSEYTSDANILSEVGADRDQMGTSSQMESAQDDGSAAEGDSTIADGEEQREDDFEELAEEDEVPEELQKLGMDFMQSVLAGERGDVPASMVAEIRKAVQECNDSLPKMYQLSTSPPGVLAVTDIKRGKVIMTEAPIFQLLIDVVDRKRLRPISSSLHAASRGARIELT